MVLRSLKARVAVIAAVTVLGAAAAVAPAAVVTVSTTQNSTLGVFLVNVNGLTLYTKAAIGCSGGCAATWPPLLLAAGAKPVAGKGVKASLLGTLKLASGKQQVTYGGKPLFLYVGDHKQGDVKGQGVGGIWHVVAPTGVVVLKALTSPAAGKSSTSGSSSGTSSSSGGSSGTSSSSGGATGSNTGGNTGGGGGGGATTGNDCANNPGGYGCM